MSRWFRHYAGMMRDDKLVRVAIHAKQSIERVVWVWGAILESASEIDDAGRFEIDCAEIAYFLHADESDIKSIADGLSAAGRLAADRVVKWGDRQFQSDRSAQRQARYRNKKRGQEGDSDAQQLSPDEVVTSLNQIVTSPSRHGDAPEYRDREQITTTVDAREPRTNEVSKDEEGELFAVAGKALSSSPSLFVMATPMAWKAADYDWLLDIIAAIRTKSQHCRPGSVQSWNYFTQAIADWHAKRTAPIPAGNPERNGHARAPKSTTADLARELSRQAGHRERERDDGGSEQALVVVSRAG